METFIAEMAGMGFTNERGGTVEMGIPGYRAKGEK